MTRSSLFVHGLVVAVAAAALGIKMVEGEICTSPTNVFHARVDLFASELGHYTFEECGDQINPTLGLVPGQIYTFIQADRSNYYHPFGIAGMYANETFWLGDTHVLDPKVYEHRFVEPASKWKGYGSDFNVRVQIDLPTQREQQEPEEILQEGEQDAQLEQTKQEQHQDLNKDNYYYFCILHHGMEGRIVLLPPAGSSPSLDGDSGAYPDTTVSFQDTRSDFDKSCGTYGLGQFQLPHPLCPDRFVCGTDQVTDELQHFAACLEAANCAMLSGMTTGVKATDDAALFIHQMIPHHANAVNTAKVLLKSGSLLCPDLTDTTNPNCVLEAILRQIIADQNHQIQLMRKFLSDFQYPQEDNCDVYVETVDKPDVLQEENIKEGSNNGRGEATLLRQEVTSSATGAARVAVSVLGWVLAAAVIAVA